MHQLNHLHWAEVHENKYPVAGVEDGLIDWRNAPPLKLAEKDTVEALGPAKV